MIRWEKAAVEVWVRRGCAILVAVVAAYASYEHQRAFALRGGADGTSAALWPLSVDGLLLLASTGLLRGAGRRHRWVLWLAFLLGIAVSLAANIAAAPVLGWQPVLVAGWPPVSLLLAVELLSRRLSDRDLADPAEPDTGRSPAVGPSETPHENTETSLRGLSREDTAETVMWRHFQHEVAVGREPSGAELDRVAGTNNYGRAVLRRWRQNSRIHSGINEALDG